MRRISWSHQREDKNKHNRNFIFYVKYFYAKREYVGTIFDKRQYPNNSYFHDVEQLNLIHFTIGIKMFVHVLSIYAHFHFRVQFLPFVLRISNSPPNPIVIWWWKAPSIILTYCFYLGTWPRWRVLINIWAGTSHKTLHRTILQARLVFKSTLIMYVVDPSVWLPFNSGIPIGSIA